MKRHISHVLLVILLLGVRAGWSQAATPEAALEELVTTEDIKVALTHLPPEAQKIIDSLSQDNQKEFAQRLLPQAWLKARTLTLSREGSEWQVMWREKRVLYKVSIASSMVSGTDAIVRLLFDSSAEYLVAMRLEKGEWRLTAFGNWEPKRISSSEFLRRLTPIGGNEAAALKTLEEIRAAVTQYAGKHSETGFPASLQALSAPDNSEDTGSDKDQDSGPDNSLDGEKVDPTLLEIPLTRNGYEFHYTLLSPGDSESGLGDISITAVPLEFRTTGERSFYTDETGMIRFTNEDRMATENDEELDRSFTESQGSPINITVPCANGIPGKR